MTTPPEPQAPPPAEAGLDQRVSAIEGKLDQVLGFLSSTPDKPAEPDEAERPEVNIADEIRRQLAERDKKAAARPAEPAAAKPAETAEKPPVAPVRKVSRVMGWAE